MILTVPDIIKKKRDRNALRSEEINYFIQSVVNKTANDGQIGAWLMAVYLNGMSDTETTDLTKAMVESGERLEWEPSWSNILVDKHSTGGVGDKISLILAPALAALGLKVPMLSGRGLGWTGGTLDKLESIPGFQVMLTYKEMYKCLDKVGCFIAGQTNTIASADKILYMHRDLTATVDCLPLIASSILSKKVAENTHALVMDIKVGNGALLKNKEEAEELAHILINISKGFGIETTAVLTDMNVPIGINVGNALEVIESVECLRNRGSNDVINIAKTLGGLLLHRKGISKTLKEGENLIEETFSSKRALKKFQDMLINQGVSQEVAAELCKGNYSKVLPEAEFTTRLPVKMTGHITSINAKDIAQASWYLGAGRSEAFSSIDHAVGIKLLKTVGEEVMEGEEWVEIHHNQTPVNANIKSLIENSIVIEAGHKNPHKFLRILKIF